MHTLHDYVAKQLADKIKTRRVVVWYDERSGDYSFKTLFPFWFERKQGDDRASVYGPYYQRRSPDEDAIQKSLRVQ